ncbi:hypothetical protein [Burkholderia pseudomallei]|uniref:hypothetical protein n=1 Tax=Burkholderia pseudomallei TaxID=28450 RepID=UPI00300158A8
MRTMIAAGALALLAGCAGGPAGFGSWGGPSFAQLQRGCGDVRDYGDDARSVYSAVFDAWVAKRHGKLTDVRFCAFENELAQRHAALGTNADAAARGGGSVAARRLKGGRGLGRTGAAWHGPRRFGGHIMNSGA